MRWISDFVKHYSEQAVSFLQLTVSLYTFFKVSSTQSFCIFSSSLEVLVQSGGREIDFEPRKPIGKALIALNYFSGLYLCRKNHRLPPAVGDFLFCSGIDPYCRSDTAGCAVGINSHGVKLANIADSGNIHKAFTRSSEPANAGSADRSGLHASVS